jgi:hypothetical protein
MQISAEQLLREAFERQETVTQAPNQQILDQEELDEYRLRKRKEFEDSLRKNKYVIFTSINRIIRNHYFWPFMFVRQIRSASYPLIEKK